MNLRNNIEISPSSYFSIIKRNRKEIIRTHESALSFCRTLIAELSQADIPQNAKALLQSASTDERHYFIASTYATLIGDDRRRQLSAYFTPPVLARAAIEASAQFLDSKEHPAVLDPACGGGSFLTPVARHIIGRKVSNGASLQDACQTTLKDLNGIEIDDGLSTLAMALLKDMLRREFCYRPGPEFKVVKCEDALLANRRKRYDLIIGNPPYGKVGINANKEYLQNAGRANLGGHTNLYSLFLLKSLDWLKPGGGLVFIVPTSFVAGPYFAGLRQEILERAEVLRIDLHEQRENLFLGAIQDVCLLALKRHIQPNELARDGNQSYQLGIIDASGARTECGAGTVKYDGEPWTLPIGSNPAVQTSRMGDGLISGAQTPYVLADYGYKTKVGKVVPTRERVRLHVSQQKGDYPLLWASSIRPDGGFDFGAAERLGNAAWYSPLTEDVSYATRTEAVIVQRTSNRDQQRRLNAAAVPKSFRRQHRKGFVAENHVIVLEAINTEPKLTPIQLAKLLNSEVVNERFSAVSGSFSVSAKLLERIALPEPLQVKALGRKNFEERLRGLFSGLHEVLASAPARNLAGDTENPLDEPRDLTGRLTIDQNACLKRRTVA